ncbi:hypothetical protein [Streptomyces hirsutus]|uniref:hypothetical protein n=1 Tax=Streptomyces hirsutus TaxID=35620 RepID=UPI0006E376E2
MSTRSPAGAGPEVGPLRERRQRLFQGLQKMGRSLQLPIAVLPAAGILNRLGQPDVFGDDGLGWTDVSKVMAGAGGALLDGSLGLPLLSMAVTWGLGVHDGFSFSAGLIDYVINWNLATRPWAIVPIGLCFAAVYYAVFRFAITRFDLRTPGREAEEEVEDTTKA